MTRIPKIVALLAFGMAAGCRDSYPNVVPPLDVLYYPVGIAVRQVAPTPAAPYGSSQLVVVNSNFDLRYDEQTGGSVLVVDPDRSQDTSLGGQMHVLGATQIASFGGEVAMVDGGCLPGWPDCPSACRTLSGDPTIAGGGAKLILASRSSQTIYRMSMGSDGSLECGDGCAYPLPVDRLDPFGVTTVCSDKAGFPVAYAFVSQMQSANGLGWVTRVNLLGDQEVAGLVMGTEGSYATIFDGASDVLFVSSTNTVDAQFRWFNPLITSTDIQGFLLPEYTGTAFSSFLPGAVARAMALSSDGTRLYVSVLLYDLALALQTGILVTVGGALAVFDITPTSFAQPRMALLDVARTCLGAGQVRRLPTRPSRPDLLAISCDAEGGLAIYDAEAHAVVRYIGLDPDTGLPVLGGFPFGLAVEPIDPARATIPVQGFGYDPSPCVAGGDCQRIYVGSFINNLINILELDPDRPSQVALVKRIGRGP